MAQLSSVSTFDLSHVRQLLILMIFMIGCENTQKENEMWILTKSPELFFQQPMDLNLQQADILTDQTLHTVAHELHLYTEKYHKIPSNELIEFTLAAYGIPLWGVELRAWKTSPNDQEKQIRSTVMLAQRNQEDKEFKTFVGESIQSGFQHFSHLMITAPALFQLDAVPKQLPRESSLKINFKLAQGLKSPQAIALSKQGSYSRLNISQNLDGYSILIPKNSTITELELLAHSDYGLRPLTQLNFSSKISNRWSPIPKLKEPAKNTALEKKKLWILDLLQKERRQIGLPKLISDAHLNTIAQLHVQEMDHKQYFGHTSPMTGSPFNRLKTSGYVALKVGENIAQNHSLWDAHRALYRSLGHRQNMLDPHYTHIGIGLSEHQGIYLVSQLYAQPVPLYQKSHLAQITHTLYDQARTHSFGSVMDCEDQSVKDESVCSKLIKILEQVEKNGIQTDNALHPQKLIEQTTQFIKSGEVSAWVTRAEAIEAIIFPNNLLQKGSTLALQVQLVQPQSSKRPLLEVWGLSLAPSNNKKNQ